MAAAVLRGVVNSELVAALRDAGCDAVGLSGVDGGLLIGQRIPDVGLVATVTGVRRDLLDSLLVGGQVPVVAPLARDEEGVVCNVNADDAAAGIAAGLGARQLVLMTDVDGVRDAGGSEARTRSPSAEAEALIADGTISGGHGAQGQGGARRARLGGRRGDHRGRLGAATPSSARLDDPTFGTRVSARAPRRRRPEPRDARRQAGSPCRDPAPGDGPPDRPARASSSRSCPRSAST